MRIFSHKTIQLFVRSLKSISLPTKKVDFYLNPALG